MYEIDNRGRIRMKSNEELDEMRRRIQGTISQTKRDELRDKYGMQLERTDSNLPFEAENEWLDYLLEFEQKFENAKTITVRERIGNPPIMPLNELPLHALEDAVDSFLELLTQFGIAVDFLGDWDDIAAYTYLTGEFLEEEISDMQIKGMMSVFTPSTLEYDVQMWVENFVMEFFSQERDYFLPSFDKQPLFDMQGETITAVNFRQQIEAIWKLFPPTNHFSVEPITVQVEGEEGEITAVISWRNEDQETAAQVESFFRLQPSPYTGWDVVQTSLLQELHHFFEA
ncbi:hypothetical protein MNBD_CHLOROFLEXI01-3976 [hydrothermal vent metagenome]|uniref:Uncharacterized protein n=1 Tax=hydrothermal vent metagenome TaxID=652676 RepID=A0A3B0UK80_9ZZZZ